MQWQSSVAQFDKCERPGSDIPTLHFQDSSRILPDILVTAINAILIIQPLTSSPVTWLAHIANIPDTRFSSVHGLAKYVKSNRRVWMID